MAESREETDGRVGDAARVLGVTIGSTSGGRSGGVLGADVRLPPDGQGDRFAIMYHTYPVGFAAFDGTGRVREINPAGAELLGESQGKLSGGDLVGLLTPAGRDAFLGHLREVLEAGRRVAATLDLDLDGGRAVRLFSALHEEDGERECLSTLLDVTELRESVRQAREGEALRQSVLDSLTAQIAVLDAEGRIVAVNRAWRRFAEENGVDPRVAAGIGSDYFAVCQRATGEAAADGRAALEGIRAVIGGTLPAFSMEYPCPSAGRDRWFMLTATPLESGVCGAVVANTDISRRRALEQQERRRREVMAHNSRLHAVGILASSLVHELTQPLSAATFYIGAAVAMGRDNGSDHGLIEVLEGVDAQIRRAGDIVHRLREFMRRRETNLGAVRLDEVIGRALEFVHSLALDRRVRVEVGPASEVPPVKADPVQVEQVLVNLLCNAIQAVDAGEGQRRLVRVTVVERPEVAEVTVSDTGPGVAPERMERIFDVFETDKPGGMGMGLPISREIVEAHGGRLWAEPDAGGGATFRFNLPLDHEEYAP